MDKDPGYAGKMPQVFPYKARVDAETSWRWQEALHQVGRSNYAETRHRFQDELVTLWLSTDSTDYLIDWGGESVARLIQESNFISRPVRKLRVIKVPDKIVAPDRQYRKYQASQYLGIKVDLFDRLLESGAIPPADGTMKTGERYWYARTLDTSPIYGQTSQSNRNRHGR